MVKVLSKHLIAVQLLMGLAIVLCMSNHAWAAGNITSSIVGSANGTIEPMGICEGCSSQEYIITAYSGFHLSWVKVDGALVTPEFTIADNITTFTYAFTEIDADHTIEVAFTQRISVINDSDFGTIAPAPVAPETSIEVEYGSQPSFVLTASDPCENGHTHHISDIVVDGTSTGIRGQGEKGPYTYTYPSPVTQNSTIEAQFTGHVDVTVNGPGSVALGAVSVTSTGSIEFESNIDQTFKIIAGTNYSIDSVLLDGVEQGPVPELVIEGEVAQDHTLEVTFAIDWYSIEPVSTFGSIFDDLHENTPATTKYPRYGGNQSFFVDINDDTHFVEALFIDNVKAEIPATGVTYVDPGGVFTLINHGGDTLEVKFTGVQASHRLVVLDYDRTPIADIPLVATAEAPPSNIMYIINDSNDMNIEIAMKDGVNEAQAKASTVYCGEWIYQRGSYDCKETIWDMNPRFGLKFHTVYWKTRYHGYNELYYNPAVEYKPWPRVKEVSEKLDGKDSIPGTFHFMGDKGKKYAKLAKADADTLAPRYHPFLATPTMPLRRDRWYFRIGDDAIVDDEDEDENPATEFAFSDPSHWTEQTYSNKYAYLGDYWVPTGTSPMTTDASWSYTPAKDGLHEIFVSFVYASSRNPDIKYEIICPDCNPRQLGIRTVEQHRVSGYIDEVYGYPGYSLGRFFLQAGKKVTVHFRTPSGGFGKDQVSVDAVRFTPVYAVPEAHYFMLSETDGSPYLVAFDWRSSPPSIRY